MRQAIGPRKLRQISRRFGREVTEVLVRGGSPHGCGWAKFAGEPGQVWINWAEGRYLHPATGLEVPDYAAALEAVNRPYTPPEPPTPEYLAEVAEIAAKVLGRLK